MGDRRRDPVDDMISHLHEVWRDHPGHTIEVRRYALVRVNFEGRRIDVRTVPLDAGDDA